MTEQSGPTEEAAQLVPEWATNFPNPWKDPELIDQSGGNENYLNLLAWARVYDLRAATDPDNPAYAADAQHRRDIVRAYEQYKGLQPPVDS